MPLYMCSSQTGTISPTDKQRISKAITDIHCGVTGAPANFVHVFFFESGQLDIFKALAPADASAARYQLYGSIRAGRSDEIKNTLVEGMRQSVADILETQLSDVVMTTRDVEAKWVMEGGDLLPEPGEEAAWLEKHNKKLAATTS